MPMILGSLHEVDDLSLTVPQEEWPSTVGFSESGKTTLIEHTLAAWASPRKRRLACRTGNPEALSSSQLADVRKNVISLVLQKFYLAPHLIALGNVPASQYYHCIINKDQAMEAINQVGMADRAHHLLSRWSDGEQHRVCLALALVNCPKLILADEPTGNLDVANERIALDLFRSLHRQGTTLIMATHDTLVASHAQREVMLNHGVPSGRQWNDETVRVDHETEGRKPATSGGVQADPSESFQQPGDVASIDKETKAATTDTDKYRDGTSTPLDRPRGLVLVRRRCQKIRVFEEPFF